MANTIVQLPLDLSGTSPNNLVGAEEHLLVSISGFPYRIIAMEHGGFYTKSLKVFDENYNRLKAGTDFIWTYRHKNLSERTGRDIASAIVFLNQQLQGKVYLQAQMVGGDLAFSFTVVNDYITFFKSKPAGYVPATNDYDGTEPIWGPGELAQERWGLDKYQPLNNELEKISRAITIGALNAEGNYRTAVKSRYDQFMARFNTRLQNHIDDRNDPHAVTPEQVGLGTVNNYPVATQAGAETGTSDDHYLTPNLVHYVINRGPTTALNNHVNLRPADPHVTLPGQVNAHSKQQMTANLAALHNRSDTVNNTNAVFWAGRWMGVDEYRDNVRANLDASAFPSGMLSPLQLTYGTPTGTRILRGDGSWTDISQLIPEYGTQENYKLIQLSAQSSVAVAMNVLNTVYSSLTAAPIGTVAFFTVYTRLYQGQGNGADYYGYNLQYAAARTNAGWQQV
ncbi:virion structural protein [Pseudomonas phage D6]|nr:virion structural protein [Pseudomonas phage D6]